MNGWKHSLLLNFWTMTMTKNRIFLFTNICWKQEKFSSYCIWLCVYGNGWMKDRQCLTQYLFTSSMKCTFIERQGKSLLPTWIMTDLKKKLRRNKIWFYVCHLIIFFIIWYHLLRLLSVTNTFKVLSIFKKCVLFLIPDSWNKWPSMGGESKITYFRRTC